GWHFSPSYVERYMGIKNTSVVCITAGGDPPVKFIKIDWHPDSQVWRVWDATSYFGGGDRSPTPGKNIPRPADFTPNKGASLDDPKSYLYGAQHCPGQVLRHEAQHDRNRLLQRFADYVNEYLTDLKSMESIKRAWTRFKEKTDNSGYYVQFKIKEEFGGGFIVTEAPIREFRTTTQMAMATPVEQKSAVERIGDGIKSATSSAKSRITGKLGRFLG
ncbi:MAG: hypothetical protein ABID04_00465, partial [Patescibacteria group bacterium]